MSRFSYWRLGSKNSSKISMESIRFEVKFTTPTLSFGRKVSRSHLDVVDPVFLDGSNKSKELTYCNGQQTFDNADFVGWLSLLENLQTLGLKSVARDVTDIIPTTWPVHGNFGASTQIIKPVLEATPVVRFIERSWDLMPAEITRPIAYSTVGDIIILAHRLGLVWQELNPGSGVMYAEGNGQSMTASMVRGWGTIVQYSSDSGNLQRSWLFDLFIPSVEADKLGFGILTGDTRLNMADIQLSSRGKQLTGIMSCMRKLGVRNSAIEAVRTQWEGNKTLRGFADIVPIVMPFLPLAGLVSRKVMQPLPHTGGPLFWKEGRAAFTALLRQNSSTITRELLLRCDEGRELWRRAWRHDFRTKFAKTGPSLAYLDWLRKQHEFATSSLHSILRLQENEKGYFDLAVAHLSCSPLAVEQTEQNQQNNSHCDLRLVEAELEDDGNDEIKRPARKALPARAETFYEYADNLPQIVVLMNEKDFQYDDLSIRDAWWTMIFRALIWNLSVAMVSPQASSEDDDGGIIVPSNLWDSRVPVYIT